MFVWNWHCEDLTWAYKYMHIHTYKYIQIHVHAHIHNMRLAQRRLIHDICMELSFDQLKSASCLLMTWRCPSPGHQPPSQSPHESPRGATWVNWKRFHEWVLLEHKAPVPHGCTHYWAHLACSLPQVVTLCQKYLTPACLLKSLNNKI